MQGMGHLVTEPLEPLVKWDGVQLTALYNSGATMTLIHQEKATHYGWEVDWSDKARLVNIDRTTGQNPLGRIQETLDIGGHTSWEEALVGNIR